MNDKQTYIIANPCHSLGFLVMTRTEPIGFTDQFKALITLERLRIQQGDHLKLYQTIPVTEPLMLKCLLEAHNRSNGIKYFDYNIIREYLKED